MKFGLLGFLLAVIGLAACAGGETAQSADSSAGGTGETESVEEPSRDQSIPEIAFGADFEESDCEFAVPAGVTVDCGFVEVPTDWDDLDSAPIRLHVGVAQNANTPADATPVIYFEGGPGGDALGLFQFSYPIAFEPIVSEQPMIFFSQRGAAFSEPSMQCAAMDDAQRQAILSGESLISQVSSVADVFGECVEQLEADGVDFDEATTENAARDVDAIRQALGFETLSVYSVSYGTRLAQSYVRQFPDTIDGVVLDAVLPVNPTEGLGQIGENAERSLNQLFESCAASESCAETYPDLEERFFDLYNDLEADPVEVEVSPFVAGSDGSGSFDGDALIGTTFSALYGTETIAVLPEVVAELENDETELLEFLVTLDFVQIGFVSVVMNQAVICNDYVRFISEGEFAAGASDFAEVNAGLGTSPAEFEALVAPCELLDLPDTTDAEFEQFESDVPTLLLGGAFDPITPPSNAELVASQFNNSQVVILDQASHGVIGDECGQQLILEFYATLGEVDTSCGEGRSNSALPWGEPLGFN